MKRGASFFIAIIIYLNLAAQSVGIGTNTPHSSAMLEIKSTNKGLLIPRVDDFTNAIASPAKGLIIYDSARAFFYYYNGIDWKQVLNDDDQYWSRGTNRISLVHNADKVGIGTSNPLARVQINHRNTATSPSLTLVDSSTGTGSAILFSKLGGTSSFNINSIITTNAVNDFLNFQHGSTTPILSLRGDNKVGINTTSPTAALQVNHKNTGSSPSLLLLDSTGGSGSSLNFGKQGFASNFLIWSGINGASASGNSLNFQHSGGSPVMTIKGDGKVGINEESPANALDVGGDVNVTGKLKINGSTGTANQVLVSNGSGASQSWENISAIANGVGAVGYGSWGDCSMNSISGFQPVTDTSYNVADFFGSAVSISGNYAVIGSPGDDPTGVNNAGSVNIYKHNGIAWEFLQKIKDGVLVSGADFGTSVSLVGNFLVIGANGDITGGIAKGSVSVYQFNGTSWVFMQELTNATGIAGDDFGYSVCLSGNYLIVGSPNEQVGAVTGHGSAFIYNYNGSSWVFMQKVTGTVGANGDHFGYSVSISGNTAFIGMPSDDVGANTDQGSAFIYEYNGSSWLLNTQLFDNSFGTPGAPFDNFGYAVSVSGNYAIIGSPHDDVGTNADQGSVIVYRKNGANWVLLEKITEASTTAGSRFGSGLKFSGNYFIVGSPYQDNGSNLQQGSATIYALPGNYVQRLQYILEPNGKIGDRLGYDVAVDPVTMRFILGASKTGCVGLCATAPGKAIFGKIN